ncbi:MAG TPA: 23S rRNA (adenine(2503)-C(2))-methyltransferase RlmN [Phycisphaerales bacterium]|nr:23S rRNA (adenine(2503)-C(2))-methyltransferase RlmN [Phycisphaerales bacterium]
MRAPRHHLFQHTPDSLRAWFAERGLPSFRAAQVLDWVYRKGIADPALMTNLAKRERDMLAAEMTFLSGGVLRHQLATDGTQKLLVEWQDSSETARQRDSEAGAGSSGGDLPLPLHPSLGAQHSALSTHTDRQTECVMIPSEDPTKIRRTACISSQVGCPVGCRFCASGLGGLDANLTAGRIVEQVWLLNDMLRRQSDGATERRSDEGEPQAATAGLPSVAPSLRRSTPSITNIVFMGMGEPLANLSNVVHAVRTIAAPWGFHISARRITISTVGLPRAIERLAEQLELPVTLALSLHAPNDELRRELIPWAEYTTIPELLAACQAWFRKTGREITLEYILLGGVNDRPEHAQQLAGVAKSLRANINLIRYNEVEPLPFKRPRSDDVHEFQRILRVRGVNAHIRASRGRDIAAACGQLRHEAAG